MYECTNHCGKYDCLNCGGWDDVTIMVIVGGKIVCDTCEGENPECSGCGVVLEPNDDNVVCNGEEHKHTEC